uniref:NusB antitermination factor n=1 Tax=uncultured organism TaxID=155900 RepID=M1Q2J9_9ZZZZ|nr:NusB antitermination factor [uncultured organism]
MQRREAREEILKALYGSEFKAGKNDSIDDRLVENDPGEQEPFVREMYQGTLDQKEEIDRMISEFAVGWEVDRLAFLDRNILRMALYELLYYEDTPAEVVMNEAIELAKEYGTENAPKFINGILDKIWKERQDTEGELSS